MGIKQPVFIFILITLTLGMARVPSKPENSQGQEIIIRSLIEQLTADIEAAYAAKDPKALMSFLDKDFESRPRFESFIKACFISFKEAHLHFIVDMVVNDKEGMIVRLHWLKSGVTESGETLKSRGRAELVFKKYPEGLKLLSIRKENPFF